MKKFGFSENCVDLIVLNKGLCYDNIYAQLVFVMFTIPWIMVDYLFLGFLKG